MPVKTAEESVLEWPSTGDPLNLYAASRPRCKPEGAPCRSGENDDSPFFIEGRSIDDESPDWKDKARTRIKRADQVIVICGNNVDTATVTL